MFRSCPGDERGRGSVLRQPGPPVAYDAVSSWGRRAVAWVAFVGVSLSGVATLAGPTQTAMAHATSGAVRWVADEAAPTIGLIGDSTLSGVRWADRYGDLQRFNFLFDAESCRRTVERSCWSREQYRPPTAFEVLRDHQGEWGRVLVMMTGYNDSSAAFVDGVRTIVDEARRQGIESVVWLSLRTKGVDYEEPLHLANGSTYRAANRSLYVLAEEFDGYLQIADWATHSAQRAEWFESDGVHLASGGVDALTAFIAAQAEVVLNGGSTTPAPPPWEEVREGDDGELVAEVQEALAATGLYEDGNVDGVFGPRTAEAVIEFQRRSGVAESGTVDEPTAIALGVHQPASVPSPSEEGPSAAPADTSGGSPRIPGSAAAGASLDPEAVTTVRVDGSGAGASDGSPLWPFLVALLALGIVLLWARRHGFGAAPESASTDGSRRSRPEGDHGDGEVLVGSAIEAWRRGPS